MSILSLDSVTKVYKKKVAVDHVSFDVPKASIFGLLGPNGAGKTSLIRIITTITRADEGTVFFDGRTLNSSAPEQIGYMPEERGLYKKMKVGEHLVYLARLKGMSATAAKSAIKEWMEKFEISDWWNKRVEELSKGMQQKIQFIATVVHRPKLLILDEPFSGLDPINTNLIKDEINKMHQDGISIIFSTHRMEQVEEICKEIVLINQGKNILQGTVQGVKDQFKDNVFELKYDGHLSTLSTPHTRISDENGVLRIQVPSNDAANLVLKEILAAGIHVSAFNEILPTLNDIFIKQVESYNDTMNGHG